MSKYFILVIGILLLVASFIWMIIMESSTGSFLILGAVSGAVIDEGIHRIKKEKKDE